MATLKSIAGAVSTKESAFHRAIPSLIGTYVATLDSQKQLDAQLVNASRILGYAGEFRDLIQAVDICSLARRFNLREERSTSFRHVCVPSLQRDYESNSRPLEISGEIRQRAGRHPNGRFSSVNRRRSCSRVHRCTP